MVVGSGESIYSLLIVSSYSYLGTLIFLEMEPGIYAYKEVIR